PEAAPIPPNPSDPGARFGVAEGHVGDYGHFLVASGPFMFEGAPKLDFSVPPVEQLPAAGLRPASFTLVRNPSWNPSTDRLRRPRVDRIVFVPVAADHPEQAVERGDVDLVMDWDAPPDVVDRYEASPRLKRRLFEAPEDSQLYLTMNLAVPPLDDI